MMPALSTKNTFTWKGAQYTNADDGLFVAMPNPYNAKRTVYLFAGNSALQLYQMTKRYQPLPSWAVFKGECEKGYLEVEGLSVSVVR
jgi:hypothetical protein